MQTWTFTGTAHGMIAADHQHLPADHVEQAAAWLQDGSPHNDETGVDNAVEAFLAIIKVRSAQTPLQR